MGYSEHEILESLPWARHFARTCAAKFPSHLDRDDLQSAGVLGYLRAAARYDAALGATFRGYCAVRIRGAVLDELRRWDWAPRSVHLKLRRITRITANLVECLEREPTPSELASVLGVEEAELLAFQALSQPHQVVSLDELADNGRGGDIGSLKDRLADPVTPSPDAALLSAEDQKTMLQCMSALPKAQATVIVLHYLQNIPLRDVAAILAVTPSRVSQLHHLALERLRQAWQRKHGVRQTELAGYRAFQTI